MTAHAKVALGSEPLWDAAFRARLLRQDLSSDEISQVVALAEAQSARLERAERALREIHQLADDAVHGNAIRFSVCSHIRILARDTLDA